jgi:hypothetical protein
MYKKPNIKDPNANFQRLTMRKKHFSHAKKHQYTENTVMHSIIECIVAMVK